MSSMTRRWPNAGRSHMGAAFEQDLEFLDEASQVHLIFFRADRAKLELAGQKCHLIVRKRLFAARSYDHVDFSLIARIDVARNERPIAIFQRADILDICGQDVPSSAECRQRSWCGAGRG